MSIVDAHRRYSPFRRGLVLAVAAFGLTCGAVPVPAFAADITKAVELFRTGEYDSCADLCQEAITQGDYSETWRILRIQSQLARGRYQDALVTLDEALPRFATSIRLRWIGITVSRFAHDIRRSKQFVEEIDRLVTGSSWRYTDPVNRIVVGRFYLERGIDAKQVLEATFNASKKLNPELAEPYLAAGQLALEKHDYALAAEEFRKALDRDASDPDIQFGLAQALAPSDEEKSTEHLQAALKRNPNHVDSMLLAIDSHVDAERYAEARALLARIFEVNPCEPRAWAYRAVLAHLESNRREEWISRETAFAWWTANPEVDHLIGRKLSQKYRFREGSEAQKRALAFDSQYLPAKVQLSQDLLRLGQEADGWRLAEEVFEADSYNVVAHNLTTLRDHVSKFRTLSEDGIVVHMDAHEADIYGSRVLALLRDAKKTLANKYDVKLSLPIYIEIFPEQQDFAIRTFGLPGGDGFLGVCFGSVITANSPAALGATSVSWESVLWHEFCHVVTLQKTNNKMPRWLSEGISVYEERKADPTWGQSMTPSYREMILGGELTPVSELSGAFLNAPSGAHLQFAYYESSLVVEFLVERYGIETLKRVLNDLSVGMPINESLGRYTGSIAALDQEFAEYANKLASGFAADADWSELELAPTADLDEVDAWLEKHPNHYEALGRKAATLMAEERWSDAKAPLKRMLELCPTDGEPYTLLAQVHRELGERAEELIILEGLSMVSSDASEGFLRLMELHSDAKNWDGATRAAKRMLAVNPLISAPHRSLAAASEATADFDQAIDSLQTLLFMAPFDYVDIHFRLARLLQNKGDRLAAKRHLLQALEDAPRFRAAHTMLLELVRQEPTGNSPAAETPATVEKLSGEQPVDKNEPAAKSAESKPVEPESADVKPADAKPSDASTSADAIEKRNSAECVYRPSGQWRMHHVS